jgi:hypothetical protein
LIHGSNARNLCIAVLTSTSKNALSLIIAYVFCSTKLEIRAEQVLPGSEGVEGEREATMIQTMYAPVNKQMKKKEVEPSGRYFRPLGCKAAL